MVETEEQQERRRVNTRGGGQAIRFPPLTRGHSSSSPMIIEAHIEGQSVHRVYLDGGSTSEIIYEHCFIQLKVETRRQLRKSDVPLIGFSGERVMSIGEVVLKVTLGEGKGARTEELLFPVVQSPSSYNVLIGRPWISGFEAVVSTAHGMMHFPTLGGVTTIEAEKREGQVCTVINKAKLASIASTRGSPSMSERQCLPGEENSSKESFEEIKTSLLGAMQT
jgi:hypothetical protein